MNLRFYVRRKSADMWRRGVVFVRELVPKHAIAIGARTFYGEPYLALPMKRDIVHRDGELNVEYSWRRGRKWESLKMNAHGKPQSFRPALTLNSSPSITGATPAVRRLRIPRRTSTLEGLECRRLRIQRGRGGSLRRTIRNRIAQKLNLQYATLNIQRSMQRRCRRRRRCWCRRCARHH